MLSRNGVVIGTVNEVATLMGVARKSTMEAAELARFIEHKCCEKAAQGDPVRSVKFFLHCIPGDIIAYRSTLTRKHAEHSPPRFWKDPYENLTPEGESHE